MVLLDERSINCFYICKQNICLVAQEEMSVKLGSAMQAVLIHVHFIKKIGKVGEGRDPCLKNDQEDGTNQN